MKILKSSLKQVSRSCPSKWTGTTDEDVPLEISFRTGRLVLAVQGGITVNTDRDQFDVSSYIELEEVLSILEKKEGIENT